MLLPTPFLNIGSRLRQNHGLIGVAFPPDYATSRRFYVNYTPLEGQQPRIARYTTSLNPNVANTTEEILLHTGNGGGDHNSGWMDFGRDGYLYIARGDAGGAPQDPTQFQGKILRLDVSTPTGYTVPADNPYVGIAGLDEVVAMGIRNSWRNGFDSLTGTCTSPTSARGASRRSATFPSGPSPDATSAGRASRGIRCNNPNPPCSCTSPSMTPPIHAYGRDLGSTIIGGTVYRGDAIPRWRGRYFFLDYGSNRIWSFRAVAGVRTDLQEHTTDLNESLPAGQRLSRGYSFGADAAGELYVIEGGGGS